MISWIKETHSIWKLSFLLLILSISNCVIFYPLVEKSFEVEDKSGSYAIAALYALADKEAPRAGNGGQMHIVYAIKYILQPQTIFTLLQILRLMANYLQNLQSPCLVLLFRICEFVGRFLITM